ncbi:hypothetical protein BDQ17DRAFT_1368616 [Cyathus striatus]|nr:hypothetical protein BDQ17DRAFT_1368616 [Cyathus striatus]
MWCYFDFIALTLFVLAIYIGHNTWYSVAVHFPSFCSFVLPIYCLPLPSTLPFLLAFVLSPIHLTPPFSPLSPLINIPLLPGFLHHFYSMFYIQQQCHVNLE